MEFSLSHPFAPGAPLLVQQLDALPEAEEPVEYGGVWWSMVEYGGVWWSMVEYGGVWWSMVEYGGVWWCGVLIGDVGDVGDVFLSQKLQTKPAI